MSRTSLFILGALIAAPAFALEEGTYPVTIGSGIGELELSERLMRLQVTAPAQCEMTHEAPVLRGAEGGWAGLIGEDCVLVGSRVGFHPVGAGCSALLPAGCALRGEIVGERTAGPVQVIRPLLEGRFSRLPEADRRAVQAILAEEGLYGGAIDGVYGDGTEAALIGQLQRMADRGEPVDGNSASFLREMISGLAVAGRELVVPAAPAAQPASGATGPAPYVGSWSCAGVLYRFTEDGYRLTEEANGALIAEGRLRPDGVDGGIAYLELVGYGNLTFFGVGTGEMFVHDPRNAESYDCFPR